MKRCVGPAILLLALAASIAWSQQTSPRAVSGGRAFAAEAVGGTLGSAIGIGIGLAVARPDDCPSEDDVVCTLRRLGVTGAIGVVGATAGTVVAGRLAGADPSLVGAFVGAAAGTAAGIGLEHLITEEMGQPLGNVGAVLLFSVTQGILSAAGSRLAAHVSRR